MTLGKPGGGEAPSSFFQPNAVAIASNGDIFVAQNHTAHDDKSRVLVFSPEGKFIKSFGGTGSGAGELDVPHALAFDANGRVWSATATITASRCSTARAAISASGSNSVGRAAIVVTPDQMIYVGDSESQSRDPAAYAYHPGCEKGIRFGRLSDAKVLG